MRPESVQESLAWLRPVLSVVTTLCVALLAYAVVCNLGRPRNPHPDPALAIRLIPLELGLVAGVVVFRSFGRRQQAEPRPDSQERMVTRLALRRGGSFTLSDLLESSPLTETQAREALGRMVKSGRLEDEGARYRMPRHV